MDQGDLTEEVAVVELAQDRPIGADHLDRAPTQDVHHGREHVRCQRHEGGATPGRRNEAQAPGLDDGVGSEHGRQQPLDARRAGRVDEAGQSGTSTAAPVATAATDRSQAAADRLCQRGH